MVMEVLIPTAAIRNLIREDKIHQIYSAMQTGTGTTGMQTFNQSLANAYFQKQITMEVALARSSNQDELQDLINRGVSSTASANVGKGAGSALIRIEDEEVLSHAGFLLTRARTSKAQTSRANARRPARRSYRRRCAKSRLT